MTGFKDSGFGKLLAAMGYTSTGGESLIAYECTLSEAPARAILRLFEIAYGEGQAPSGPQDDALLRAIAFQHPGLVAEFGFLPWPHLTKKATP